MGNSYRNILKKITNTEKRLRPSKQELNAILDYEIEQQEQQNEVIEDYKNFKENIAELAMDNFNLAYQPIKIKPKRWAAYDY